MTNITKENNKEKLIEKSIVGEFDISKYSKEIKTATTDVVLFEERINHIKERHPEMERYIKFIPLILKSPDMILKEVKRKDTIWIIKQIKNNIKITIKLNTSSDKKLKNSIIQMQILNQKIIDKYEQLRKIEKLFDKNNKK